MSSPNKSLIYGTVTFSQEPHDGLLVFYPKGEAADLAAAWHAVHNAKTWRELRNLMPAGIYEGYVASDFDEGMAPSGDTPFEIGEVYSGDAWPYDPFSAMLDFLPHSVQVIGETGDSPASDDWLHLAERLERQVVALLTTEGWRVERNDDLMRRAGGDWLTDNFATDDVGGSQPPTETPR